MKFKVTLKFVCEYESPKNVWPDGITSEECAKIEQESYYDDPGLLLARSGGRLKVEVKVLEE